MFFIYLIINLNNQKVYVGKTNDITKRWSDHLKVANAGPSNKSFSVIHAAIRKHGADNFTVSIIEEVNTEELAIQREIYWISYYKSNIQEYGDQFGYNLTNGGEGWSTGHKHTQKSKDKMSKYKKEHPNSPETNKKISKALAGREFSDEHKQKLSVSGLGENNSNAKLTKIQARVIKSLLNDGLNYADVARIFNISSATVYNIKRGKVWKNA